MVPAQKRYNRLQCLLFLQSSNYEGVCFCFPISDFKTEYLGDVFIV